MVGTATAATAIARTSFFMFEPPEFSNRHRLESAMAGWGCRGLAARPTHSLPPPNRWAQPVTSSADQRGVAVAPVGGGFEQAAVGWPPLAATARALRSAGRS